MKLVELFLQNIKSYYPTETIVFEKDINIFVGPNAGGKSNLFEIIQGVINSVILYHVTISPHDKWNNPDSSEKEKPYTLNFDQSDSTNLAKNILDKHLGHEGEPSILRMKFLISKNDIDLINNIISGKDRIRSFMESNITNSAPLIEMLDEYSSIDEFKKYINKTIIVEVSAPNSIHVSARECSKEEYPGLDRLFKFIRYSNVFHELSTIIPELESHPMFRYFSPHRNPSQILTPHFLDISKTGNYDDNFAKGQNQNKETQTSFINSSYLKICHLYRDSKRNKLLREYKKYLKKFLKVNFEIKIKPHATNNVYEITHDRISLIPLKMSSGEREFLNLISGLILTGIKNGIVLLDEPELHLHFQWQQSILELIEQLSKDFDIQFFIVTHSPKFINEKTLPYIHRVYLDSKTLSSKIIKPTNPLGSNKLKDIVQFINTTNNEKAFFARKVILVEGISDLIFFTKVVEKLKNSLKIDNEVEVIEVGSKSNLIRFRNLLKEWKIENLIIADLDYLKEIRKLSLKIIQNKTTLKKIVNLKEEIDEMINFSEKKLKEILFKKPGRDGYSLIQLILKKNSLPPKEFNSELESLLTYISTERATKVILSSPLSTKMNSFFKDIANKEDILVIKSGSLESILPELANSTQNKVSRALKVSRDFKLQNLKPYLNAKITKFLEE